jgi:CHAT domain-containing protein
MLLGAVAPHITNKRLVVVADGALLYVPFSLLDSPAAADRPLILDHEVVHLPSMSSLLAMRRTERPARFEGATVGIIADPVFAADDVRVVGRQARVATGAQAPATRGDLGRAATDSGLVRFPRLRFTRQEAEGIAALVPSGRRIEALDFAASRQTASSDSFARQTILHFATHGLINSVHPELSGLVLSLVDPQGQPQEGFLRLHDIYNLKLGADLVVLSACQTALGKDIRGEGLIGLTRGFMYAGAPRVVASLWEVDDRATAELMKRLYEGMLVRGLTPRRCAPRRAARATARSPLVRPVLLGRVRAPGRGGSSFTPSVALGGFAAADSIAAALRSASRGRSTAGPRHPRPSHSWPADRLTAADRSAGGSAPH